MRKLIVVDKPSLWPIDVPETEVVAAREYLTDPRFVSLRHARVFNVCGSRGYQSAGYYVSLLATARGHRPLPSVTTVQDLRLSPVVRLASESLEDVLQRAFAGESAKEMSVPIYFGRNPNPAMDRLCGAVFDHFPAPLLRAQFVCEGSWRLASVHLLAGVDVEEAHRDFVVERARRYFDRPRSASAPSTARYDLALLLDAEESDAPSDEAAVRRFERAGEQLGLEVTRIDRNDQARLGEFDALFIRATTYVNHYTYRFSSRAAADGLVVVDDPESIVRCTNKVYLAEAFHRGGLPTPRTLVAHRDNRDAVGAELGFPCVLKRPDSSFSMGVARADDSRTLGLLLDEYLEKSVMVVAQEYTPSDFDWRIGVLDGRPLYACRYHMAPGHWQIQKVGPHGGKRYGKVETVDLENAPQAAVELAVRATALVGRGFYGVDIKELDGRFVVMEVNDNPNVDSGYEDAALGDELYLAVMRFFVERLERRGTGAWP